MCNDISSASIASAGAAEISSSARVDEDCAAESKDAAREGSEFVGLNKYCWPARCGFDVESLEDIAVYCGFRRLCHLNRQGTKATFFIVYQHTSILVEFCSWSASCQWLGFSNSFTCVCVVNIKHPLQLRGLASKSTPLD